MDADSMTGGSPKCLARILKFQFNGIPVFPGGNIARRPGECKVGKITFLLVHPRSKGELPFSHWFLDFRTCESELWETQHCVLADSQHTKPPGEASLHQSESSHHRVSSTSGNCDKEGITFPVNKGSGHPLSQGYLGKVPPTPSFIYSGSMRLFQVPGSLATALADGRPWNMFYMMLPL